VQLAQVAREVVGQLLARGLGAARLVMLVGRPQRHHEARRAEAALRAVAVDQRLLHRVQAVHGVRALVALLKRGGRGCLRSLALVLEVLDREQRLAVERGQELDAGIDRLQPQAADRVGRAGLGQLADHHGARTAVALVATLLGAGAARVLAQPVEHRAGRVDATDVDDLSAMEESDGLAGAVAAALGTHAVVLVGWRVVARPGR
jgi:hypothetical protein